ncbi:MAG: family 16 glycosylhydrolase [Verrucomicrobiota bacterium]
MKRVLHGLSILMLAISLSSRLGNAQAAVTGPESAPIREGLKLWLDASDAATLELQGDQVRVWRDKSGAGNHAQAGGKPVLLRAGFGGRNAVRFGGQDVFKVKPIASKTGPVTAFIVSRRLAEQAGGTGWQRLVSIRAGEIADNKPPNLCLTTGEKSVAYPPTVKVISKDGIAAGELAFGGGAGANAGNKFHGEIAEVLVYDRGFLSDGAVLEVMNYLAAKWQAEIDRKDSGWNRAGPLGELPKRITDAWPLVDQRNQGGWVKFEEFSDEFNSGVLDTNKWMSPHRWKGREPALFMRSNVTVSNDCMTLAMRREEVPEMKKNPKFHTYTSAYVCTRKMTRYGYFEIRAKPMNSAGSSSFWFSGGTKLWRIEIDVFEIGGKALGREHAYNMNAHVFRENGTNDHWSTGGVWEAPWRWADDYHVFGLEWSPTRLAYHVDGVPVRVMPNTHWHHPQYLIFDSETMPDWFGLPKDEDLPSFFHVDYVRAWKRAGWEGAFTEEEAELKKWEPLKGP